jgi:hypothetical protein
LSGEASRHASMSRRTFSVGELRKRQAQELVPARESAQPIIAAVARDTSSKFSVWKEADQLGEHRAAQVHQPLLASLRNRAKIT